MRLRHLVRNNVFQVIFLMFVFTAITILAKTGIEALMLSVSAEKNIVVIIDPGHGGIDPGKVAVNGALEKDINLSIALKLKEFLEQNDITVIMTREDDAGLYGDNDKNKKNADMKKRIEIIKNTNPAIVISIHQNSFNQESSKGAQMFYYSTSQEGKEFAEIIQEQLRNDIDGGNNRQPKANNSYFILKNTNCPTVIVECGFLSNYEEAQKLCDDLYQEKIAWSIHLAAIKYINQKLLQLDREI